MKLAVLQSDGVQATEKGKLRKYYLVQDSYDFVSNSAIDVTSVLNLELFYKYNRLGFLLYRESLKVYEASNPFAGLTLQEQQILSEMFVVQKSDRDTVYNDTQQKRHAKNLWENYSNDVSSHQANEFSEIVSGIPLQELDGLLSKKRVESETSNFEERIYSSGKITNIIVWTDSSKTSKIQEEIISYNGNSISQVITNYYDNDLNIVKSIQEDITYTQGNISSIQRMILR